MYGVLAPRATPSTVVKQLHEAMARVVKQPENRERLIGQGYDPIANNPAEFAAYLRSKAAKWSKVIKERGMRVD
jgi:tripartite-type tricarboxylate transporter receptor subunit TctC